VCRDEFRVKFPIDLSSSTILYLNFSKSFINLFFDHFKTNNEPQNPNANVNFLNVFDHVSKETNNSHQKSKRKVKPRICS